MNTAYRLNITLNITLDLIMATVASLEGEQTKVLLALRSVGEAPALKHNKFKLSGNKCIYEVEKFLRKTLNHDKALYLYCGSGFSPTPDQLLQDLFDCFQIGGELLISYGFQETYG